MHALAPSVPADVRALLDSLGIEAPVSTGPNGQQRSPERVLGQALSLPEAVGLADALSQPSSRWDEQAKLDRAALLKQTEQRLTLLRQRVARSYAEAFAGKNALPDAARLHALLAEHEVRVAAATLARGCAELFESTLAAMQREIDSLKEAMRATLQRACSPRSRLLALDRLVDPVITREVRQAHRGLARAYESSCAARIEAAILDLSPACGVDALEALFAPRGALDRLLHDARRLIRALLDVEWSRVQALLDALCLEQDVAAGDKCLR